MRSTNQRPQMDPSTLSAPINERLWYDVRQLVSKFKNY